MTAPIAVTFFLNCFECALALFNVDVCYLDTFLFASTSRRIWNTLQLVRDYWQIQIMPVATCHIIFELV